MNEIVQYLFELQDAGYRNFQSKLIPTMDPASIIGVRTPKLRALAKRMSGTDLERDFLSEIPHRFYEENNLHALLIGQMKSPDEVFAALDDFLPHIDNWATCDMLRPKVFAGCKVELMRHIRIWIDSNDVYTVRFGLEMLMVHFLDEDFRPEYLELAAGIRGEDYYIRMMVAWYFSTALSKQYNVAIEYLQNRKLDRWTHHKTIQKAIESYRITTEQKVYLRTLRDKKETADPGT